MSLAKVYSKSLTLFSRTRQEVIVSNLEHKFYDVITIYNRDHEIRGQLHQKMEELGKEIYHSIATYYFEDDLLDYLFSLATFIMNYMQEIKTDHPAGAKTFRLNKELFDQEEANLDRN